MENEWGNSVPSRKVGVLKYKDTYSSGLTENVTCFIQKTSLNVTSCVIMVISKACCFELCNIRCTTRGEVSPALFLKSKKVPWFGKKEPKCIPLWVKFSIQNVSFGVSLFFLFLRKRLLKCPNSAKPYMPWTISGFAPKYWSVLIKKFSQDL